MKFGVVQCPKCKRARGVRIPSKTAKCPICGKTIDLKKARILCGVDSERELVAAVMEANARLEGAVND